jgi:Abortive infection alpha
MGDDADNIKAVAQGSIQGAIEGAMKPFNDLLQALLGPSVEEAGLVLRDYVTAFRIEKQVQLLDRLRKVLGRAGIKPAKVPMKLLGPIFEAATLEENNELQEIWANMLANAANPETPDAVAPSFPGILKEMRPVDVKFLATLYEEFVLKFLDGNTTLANANSTSISYKSFDYVMKKAGLQRRDKYYQNRRTEKDAYMAAVHADSRELTFILNTLQRQRIIEQEYGVTDGHREGSVEIGSAWRISELGLRFVEACRPPKEIRDTG